MAGDVGSPALTGLTKADGDVMVTVSKGMSGPLEGLNRCLNRLANCQDELARAFQGQAGDAVYNAFGNVQTTGANVARYLEQIMDQIIQGSTAFDQDDQDAVNAIKTQIGPEGHDGNVNSGTGSWNNGANNLESTTEPPKVSWFK